MGCGSGPTTLSQVTPFVHLFIISLKLYIRFNLVLPDINASQENQTNNCFFSKAICGAELPKGCSELWGVFNFLNDWSNGDCGVLEKDWCAPGKDKMSTKENTYYALCTDIPGNQKH